MIIKQENITASNEIDMATDNNKCVFILNPGKPSGKLSNSVGVAIDSTSTTSLLATNPLTCKS